MSLSTFVVSSSRRLLSPALILILAVGAMASGIGIVFQGFETDTSLWFNSSDAQEVVQEPSGYTDHGGYANGVASATGNFHARLVVDPTQCLNDGGPTAPPNNDCSGPYTYWNAIHVSDGVTTSQSNTITSATANFTAADVGLTAQAYAGDIDSPIFPPATTIISVTSSTTAVVSTNASEDFTNAEFIVVPLFSLGYITQADIYLDTAWAAGNSDSRFDWDSALRDNAHNFLSDYAFNVGTQVTGDSTPGFWVSTSTNAGRGGTYPENPCPDPQADGIGNVCRAPFKITTSGWYTFRHIFRVDPNTQNLSVEFQVLPKGGSPVVDATIYGWQGNAQVPAAGITPAYGWFANQEIPELAIDNSLLKDFDALALSPAAPGPLGAGTAQTFTVSASFGGTADPLTPGLTPANVTFTPGNADTGTVTIVPSGTQPGNGTFSFVATGGNTGSVNLTANIDGFASNAASFNVIQPGLYSPVNGSMLPGNSVTFQWTEFPGATAYWLDVGATQGGNSYTQSGSLSSSTLSYTVNSLPLDGSTVWATWYYLIGGTWQHSEYSYTAFGGNTSKGVITFPTLNSTLSGSTVTFKWTAGSGATAYWLDIGSVAGGNQYAQSGNLGNVLQTTVNGLPTNGSLLYATLYSLVSGSWISNEYTYASFNSSPGGVMIIPANGSTLPGSTVTFIWAAGSKATAYWIDAGPVPAGNTYEQSGNIGNVTQFTVNGFPTDGSEVFITLYSLINGTWSNNSYTYNAFSTSGGALAVMQTPVPSSTLSGYSATFTWSPGLSATAYWLDVGTTPGANNISQSGNLGTALTTTVYGFPQNGSTVYATLYSLVGGQWLSNSYTYGSAIAFQGFETNTGDWTDITGTPGAGLAKVPSGGGVLMLAPAAGHYYAEITNEYDTYQTGYGFGEYSLFGFANQPAYPGDFSQTVSLYISASWPTASPDNNGQAFWIDMQPGNPDPSNSGAEHNFRLTPSGSSVAITVDGQATPIVTITTSGWYRFQMTYQKGTHPTDLVATAMNVFDNSASPNLLGTTTVLSNSVSTDGPLLSQNLLGPGYVWITVWADGWPTAGANDVLAIDNARADLL